MTQTQGEVTCIRPPTDIELAAIARKFHTARVLVVGDIILDRYISGAVHRLSPEAPIPVLRPATNYATLGGAANVAVNIATLGGQAILIGVTGNDLAGDEISRLLQDTPGIRSALVRIEGRATTSKTRFMTGSHQLLRLDEEVTDPLGCDGSSAVIEAVASNLAAADVIVLSDYAKGVLCDAVLEAILARAKQTGRLVIADPKREDFAAYRGATVLTPNEHEVRARDPD